MDVYFANFQVSFAVHVTYNRIALLGVIMLVKWYPLLNSWFWSEAFIWWIWSGKCIGDRI